MSIHPPELAAEVSPPAEDRLGVLRATAPILHAGTLVTLDAAGIGALADQWAATPWPEEAGLDALHFSDGTWRTANWMLLLDALNFCFWGEPERPRWRVEWRDHIYDGYYALAAALSRAVEAGTPLWEATYLADLTADQLGEILRPVAGSPPIPLFDERLANAREAGTVLLARYDGCFPNAVEAAGHDAVALARLLADEFSSFRDIAAWRGQPVPFLKRAQICVADLSAAFHGAGLGALAHLDGLTAFADYKLPQLLRQRGALVYAPELAERVDAYAPIPAGSAAELEIRAATVWAVELLRRRLAAPGARRTASAIDYRLWAESQEIGGSARPYHRTLTVYY
jgi:hypothetical protein